MPQRLTALPFLSFWVFSGAHGPRGFPVGVDRTQHPCVGYPQDVDRTLRICIRRWWSVDRTLPLRGERSLRVDRTHALTPSATCAYNDLRYVALTTLKVYGVQIAPRIRGGLTTLRTCMVRYPTAMYSHTI